MMFFYQWFKTQDNYDEGFIQISVDNGEWQTISNPITGTNETWSQYGLDLSAYKDHTVRLGFYFISNSGLNYSGWYIDDIRLTLFNYPPTITKNIPDTSFAEDTGPRIIVDNLDSNFSDPDGSLTYQSLSDNADIQTSIQNKSLIVNSSKDYFGSGNISVTATDNGNKSITDTFMVVITPVNDPPLINLPDSIAFKNDSSNVIQLRDYASDIETADSLLTFEFSSDTSALLINYNQQTDELTLSAPGFIGFCSLYVTVLDDSNAAAYDTIKINVKRIYNQPPIITKLIPDTSFAEDSGPVMLTSDLNTYFTDPDPEDTLSFVAVSSTPAIQVTVQNRGLLLNSSPNFFGSGNIIVTAADIEGLSIKDTFTVQVTPVNDPPLASQLLLPADNDTLNSLDEPINFVWSKATDVDNDTLLYLLHIFDNTLDTLITNSNDTTNTITETMFLKPARTYQWNVLVTDKSDTVLTNSFSFITPLINGMAGSNGSLPKTYSLSQNFPNPFNPTTKISYSIPKAGKVSLKVFDMLGKEIMTLVNEEKPAGIYDVTFDASNQPSGVYLYRLKADSFVETKKLILLK